MKVLRFKTNIESGIAVENVSMFIDAIKQIFNWEVDMKSPDKVLIVRGNNLKPATVVNVVKKAGFAISPINN